MYKVIVMWEDIAIPQEFQIIPRPGDTISIYPNETTDLYEKKFGEKFPTEFGRFGKYYVEKVHINSGNPTDYGLYDASIHVHFVLPRSEIYPKILDWKNNEVE